MSEAARAAPFGTADDLGRVAGLRVGHATLEARATGCSVVLCPDGAVAGVDVRGGAPGTRETDLLAPDAMVDRIHGLVLTGGSAHGLDVASGVMRWLEARGIGFRLGGAVVPIVPAAVLFDLWHGDPRVRPQARDGEAACEAAMARDANAPIPQGRVGAGAGATVGKLFGFERAMPGGIGSASLTIDGVTVAAMIAVNAVGDVIDPRSGAVVAGARDDDGSFLDIDAALRAGTRPHLLRSRAAAQAGGNTVIGVVATDACLSKAQCKRLAMIAHDGLARCIAPAHTIADGDTLFALATHRRPADEPIDLLTLGAAAVEVVMRAVLRAVSPATAEAFIATRDDAATR